MTSVFCLKNPSSRKLFHLVTEELCSSSCTIKISGAFIFSQSSRYCDDLFSFALEVHDLNVFLQEIKKLGSSRFSAFHSTLIM